MVSSTISAAIPTIYVRYIAPIVITTNIISTNTIPIALNKFT